jgi:hypothetical protein
MTTIEVNLLSYKFSFRKLCWREEFALKFDKRRDPRRIILAAALVTVSGLEVPSFGEAYRVIETLPVPILSRVFIIYKGSLSSPKKFSTANLYRAPEPSKYAERVKKEEQQQEAWLDTRFPKEEHEQMVALDQQILNASKFKGVIRKEQND